jgi:dihydrofolate synthase/folylpolyglutamate synthase
MNYQQAVDYLYDQLPMFSKQGKSAIKKDLTNTIKLCEALGEPQKKYKTIHIAGTNGKGSTSHMLAAILQQAGYKTGLYTSPHLVDFRERIRINGVPVEENFVTDFVNTHKELIEEVEPSFFEITVAMAFDAFAYHEVDIAVIETGLGGRLDSTNVIEPILSVITNVSYDHTDILGNTLSEIAFEKAGIIKSKVPVVIGEQHPETEKVFFEQSIHKQSTLFYADAMWDVVKIKQDATHQYYKAVNRAQREMFDLACDIQGSYQKHNLKYVLAAVDVLNSGQGLPIEKVHITTALANVKKLTGLRGRWDILQQQPLIVADVAHNPAGIEEVISQWQKVPAAQKHILIGFVKDKDVEKVLGYFPEDAIYYFCNAQIPRALPAQSLAELATAKGLIGNVYNSVAEAVSMARQTLQKDDALLITGSFFVVGEAIEYLNVNNGLLFATTLE